LVGIGTTNPTANLQVTGNIYASNAVTTTNIFANTLTLIGTAGQTTLTVTNNVFVSDTITSMVNVTPLGTYVGGGTLTSVPTRAINTYSTSYPNFLATGGSHFYFYDSISPTRLPDPGLGTNTRLGRSVVSLSADGNTALAGAYAYSTGTGWVGVWRFTNGSWGSATRLPDPGLGTLTGLGYSVALSSDGNTALAGAFNYSSATGWVGVWRFTNGSWGSATRLPDPGLGTNTNLGYSVALSSDGNTALAGAYGYSTSTGWVGVWRFTNGSWGSATRLPDPGLGTNTSLGYSVALSSDGNTALAGAYGYSTSTGWVGVWRFTNGSWGSATRLPDPGLGTNTSLGFSVALSSDGNTALAGAYQYSTNTGWVGVWRFTNGSWGSASRLPDPGLGTNMFLGYSVSLSSDGNTALAGTGSSSSVGWLGVWRFTNGSWGSASRLPDPGLGTNTNLGSAVTLSSDGNTALASAWSYSSDTGWVGMWTIGPRFMVNNTLSVYNSYVGVSIGTTVPTANLHVIGNVYISNAVTTTNLFTSNAYISSTLYYNEDLTRRAPHLRPDTSNAGVITGWISAQSNIVDVQGSFWAPASRPIASNIAVGPPGSNAYVGSVAMSDGRTLFVPYGASTFGIFNSVTNQFSTVTPSGDTLTPTSGWGNGLYFGGVQAPSGNIVCIPHLSANIGVYDPEGLRFSNNFRHNCPSGAFAGGVLDGNSNVTMIPYNSLNVCAYNGSTATFANMVSISTTAPGLIGGVLLPTGNIMCIPFRNSNLIQYSPTALTFSNTTIGSGFFGGVLAPNGNIVCVPYTAANVVVVNPSGNPPYAFSNIQVSRTGGGGFAGGVLLPNGSIALTPFTNSNVGLVDPSALTYSNIVPQGGAPQANAFVGASLTIDGRVVFCPSSATNVMVLNTTTPLPSQEYQLVPYINKL
jgi:hypothetical protein